MNTIQQELTQTLSAAFSAAGYDAALGEARLSDRPELGDYQCNGALAAAKRYHKAPLVIAEEVTGAIPADAGFSAEIVRPGFINLKVSPSLMRQKLAELSADADLGIPKKAPKKIVLDYGGPNVAKPLHIGHLRSAVIGESLKRILRAVGCGVIIDISVYLYRISKSLVPILFGIPLFILCGFYHSIADVVYLVAAFKWDPAILWYYPIIVIGNFVGCNVRRVLLPKEQASK